MKGKGIEDRVAYPRGSWDDDRVAYDVFGWMASKLEWGFLFILCQENGKISKECMRGQYDGSLFYTLAKRRHKKTH